jgi:DNA-binding beta-propeller fold protein YncE
VASNLALVCDRRQRAVFAIDLDAKTAESAFAGISEPAGIAETPAQGYVVADRAGHQIVAVDDITGTNPQAFGTQGAGINEFTLPVGVAVSASGQIVIADTGNHRLVQVDGPDGSNWQAFGIEGRPTAGDPAVGKFDSPSSVAVLDDGTIVAADPASGRIVSISSIDGADWTAFGLTTVEATALRAPVWVAAKDARVYVSELGARRISLYAAFPTDSPERIPDTIWDVPLVAPAAISPHGPSSLLALDASLVRLVELHQQAGSWKITNSVNLRRLGIEEPTGACKVTA